MEVETGGESSSVSPSPSLEDCLKLLRGDRDEQRLAGLLLVTKFCNKDDHSAIRQVYHAVGPKFLLRLLRTGMGKGENREAYLQLSATLLAAFCRVPDIAASQDMLANIPLILDIMSKESNFTVIGDCYEFVFLVSNAHEDGVKALYESGGMQLLASQLFTLPDGSSLIELAMKLIQMMISKLPAEKLYIKHPSELAMMVVAIARQFALLHTALKFEALHLLSAILSSLYSAYVHDELRSMADANWAASMRSGIVAILHNRVAPAEKLQALVLAETVISIVGEDWLIGPVSVPDVQDTIPGDRCIMLVLQSSRVEIAVLLNELARMRDEASKSSSSSAENTSMKQRSLGILFSLVEKVIRLISKFGEDEESNPYAVISESNFNKIIAGLNETTGVVLEYLEDAKEHGQYKGDDLLASVRIIGSYLAETPHACSEKVMELLSYLLSVQGEDEPSPFYSICFLLPMLYQITMRTDGCKLLASSGAYKAVIGCLVSLIGTGGDNVEVNGSISLACDTIINFLLRREQIQFTLEDASFIKLLVTLSHWIEGAGDPGIVMMASSICALILDSTSEEALLSHPNFNKDDLIKLSQLIKKSLAICRQEMMPDDAEEESNLHQIVTSSYSGWADRFPHIKTMIDR